MPRSDDYDDYGDRPARSAVPFPGGVKAAGIIWIGFGILGLVGNIVSFVVNVAGGAGQGGAAQPAGSVCSLGCGILFAMAFLVVGMQTVRGTATGMLGNGIGSLVFGLLYTAGVVFTVVMAASGRLPGAATTIMFVMAGFLAVLALALLTAGILAIVGREGYAEWRAAQGLGGRRRPRTAEEQDYDDDRPRRPPRRDRDEDDDRPRRPRDED